MKRILLFLAVFCATACLTPALAEPGPADVATPGVELSAPDVTVRPASGALEFAVAPGADAPVRFEVFSITGQLVYSISLEAGRQASADLARGCYIVRTTAPAAKPLSKRFTVK